MSMSIECVYIPANIVSRPRPKIKATPATKCYFS